MISSFDSTTVIESVDWTAYRLEDDGRTTGAALTMGESRVILHSITNRNVIVFLKIGNHLGKQCDKSGDDQQ